MIFNKNNNGSDELSKIVGSYYMSNNFDKVSSDILLATSELIKVIGQPIYELAEAAYLSEMEKPDNIELVPFVQLPIAILATFNMYRQNEISHEDSGRKVKIDPQNEKVPWEWQLKRDDEIQLDRYYRAVDRLIAFLDASTYEEWNESEHKKLSKSLFINNADMFDRYFPIERSGRMYMLLLPWIKEAERKYIKPVLGDRYQDFIENKSLSPELQEAREFVFPPIPLIAMSIAIRRMPLGLIPQGVIRNYIASNHTMDASQPASMEEIHRMSNLLLNDAMDLLDDLKKALSEKSDLFLIPKNDVRNKFMRV